jgi:hypothetical protein
METETKRSIRVLTGAFYDAQRERISLDGRLGLKKNGETKKKAPPKDPALLLYIKKRRDDVYQMELTLGKQIKEEVKNVPIWTEFLQNVRGVGEQMAAVLISEIDIYRAEKPSSLWCYAGLAPEKDKPIKGVKNKFNAFLKSKIVGVLGQAFISTKSPYTKFYYEYKHRKESDNWGVDNPKPKDKDRPKAMHQHNAAKRYMCKMFLTDLYVAWRTMEGLSIREPYQEEYLGHIHST